MANALPVSRVCFLGLPFDPLTQEDVIAHLANRAPGAEFAYITTPNVQHVVGTDRGDIEARLIEAASLSLCDSRALRLLARWSALDLPLVTGSDLTAAMFARIISPGDRISVICASETLATALQSWRPEIDWDIHIPPPDALPGTDAFSECVRFTARSRARFTFVCLGAPKSEAICHTAAQSPGATGTALCTGAALEFMLGTKRRAPVVVQRLGFEWLYRMLSEPRRLGRRYLSAMLPLLRIWLRERR